MNEGQFQPQNSYGQPYYAPRPPKDRQLAMILEIVGGMFGLYGLGWLYAGNTNNGLIILIGGIAWDIFAAVMVSITVGICAIVTIPVAITVIILSSTSLKKYMDERPEIFGPATPRG